MPYRPGHRTGTLACALACLLVAASVRGGEPREKALVPVSKEDAAEIAGLLDRLGKAMIEGDAKAIGALVSPARGENARREVTRFAAEELAANRYETFQFAALDPAALRRDAQGVVAAHAQVHYIYTMPDGGKVPSTNAYLFTFSQHQGRWYIEHSKLFEQFTGMNPQSFIRQFVKLAAILLLGVAFWAWMLLDCALRYRRLSLVLAIVLTPPVGAVLYFFFGWIRGPKIVKDDG